MPEALDFLQIARRYLAPDLAPDLEGPARIIQVQQVETGEYDPPLTPEEERLVYSPRLRTDWRER